MVKNMPWMIISSTRTTATSVSTVPRSPRFTMDMQRGKCRKILRYPSLLLLLLRLSKGQRHILFDNSYLLLKNATQDRDRAGVCRIHTKVGEAACTQILATRVRRIRSVVQDTQIIRQARKIDILPHWVPRQILIFVHCIQVGAAFHLNYGIVSVIVEIQVLAILQVCSLGRYCLLVIQYRAIDQVRLHILSGKDVI